VFAPLTHRTDVGYRVPLGIVAGLGVVLLLGCGGAKIKTASPKVDVTSGRSGETRYDRALRKQTRKPPVKKLSARAYFDQGNQHESQGNDERAITAYTQAIAMDPQLIQARHRRALIYQKQGLYAAAIMDFDQVLAVAPEFAQVWYSRGVAHARVGQHDQAIKDLSVVITRHPENARAYYERGRSHYATKAFDRALKDFNKELSLNPEHRLGYSKRGLAHYGLGNYNSAVLDYTRALLYDPRSVSTYINRCWALALLGRAEKAKGDCVKAVALNPGIPHAYDALAFVFWQMGDRNRSFLALARAKALDDSFMVPKERYLEFPIILAQSLLKAVGYDPGTVDGEIGELTRSAIRKFQADHKLAVTGVVSNELLKHLRKTPAARYLYEARVPEQPKR